MFDDLVSLIIPFLLLLLQVAALLEALNVIHRHKMKKAKMNQCAKRKEFQQKKAKEEEGRLKRRKEAQKKLYRMKGQMDKKKQRSSLKAAPQDD